MEVGWNGELKERGSGKVRRELEEGMEIRQGRKLMFLRKNSYNVLGVLAYFGGKEKHRIDFGGKMGKVTAPILTTQLKREREGKEALLSGDFRTIRNWILFKTWLGGETNSDSSMPRWGDLTRRKV